MLVDIFKGYDGEPTKIDDQRAKMAKASKAKEESNIEEVETHAKEWKNKDLDAEKGKTEPNMDLEDQGMYIQNNELNLGDDDIQTAPTPQIKHPAPPNGPHLIENDEPPNFLHTRRSRYEKLFAAVDISNNCPTPRQAASRKYPLTFLCDL